MLEVNLEDLHKLQLTISRIGATSEGVRDLLWMLAMSEWEEVFERDIETCYRCGKVCARRDMAQGDAYYRDLCHWFCKDCSKFTESSRCLKCRFEFVKLAIDMGQSTYGWCPDCRDLVCALCQKPVLSQYFTMVACDTCLTAKGIDDEWMHSESIRVSVHEGRARRLNLPTNLSLRAWLKTLSDFRWKCAYCLSSPYENLDHFIPLSKMGGNLVTNCVPSCKNCNGKKGQRIPEKVTSIPRSDLDRVRAYLQTR